MRGIKGSEQNFVDLRRVLKGGPGGRRAPKTQDNMNAQATTAQTSQSNSYVTPKLTQKNFDDILPVPGYTLLRTNYPPRSFPPTHLELMTDQHAEAVLSEEYLPIRSPCESTPMWIVQGAFSKTLPDPAGVRRPLLLGSEMTELLERDGVIRSDHPYAEVTPLNGYRRPLDWVRIWCRSHPTTRRLVQMFLLMVASPVYNAGPLLGKDVEMKIFRMIFDRLHFDVSANTLRNRPDGPMSNTAGYVLRIQDATPTTSACFAAVDFWQHVVYSRHPSGQTTHTTVATMPVPIITDPPHPSYSRGVLTCSGSGLATCHTAHKNIRFPHRKQQSFSTGGGTLQLRNLDGSRGDVAERIMACGYTGPADPAVFWSATRGEIDPKFDRPVYFRDGERPLQRPAIIHWDGLEYYQFGLLHNFGPALQGPRFQGLPTNYFYGNNILPGEEFRARKMITADLLWRRERQTRVFAPATPERAELTNSFAPIQRRRPRPMPEPEVVDLTGDSDEEEEDEEPPARRRRVEPDVIPCEVTAVPETPPQAQRAPWDEDEDDEMNYNPWVYPPTDSSSPEYEEEELSDSTEY